MQNVYALIKCTQIYAMATTLHILHIFSFRLIELFEFKPRLAHRQALIAEPTSRDLSGPTRRLGAGRRQEGAGHGRQLGGGPESIGQTFRI